MGPGAKHSSECFPTFPQSLLNVPRNLPTKRAGSPRTRPVRALDGYVFDESGYKTTHQHPVSFDSTFCRRLGEVWQSLIDNAGRRR
jgi:hypothetical protein